MHVGLCIFYVRIQETASGTNLHTTGAAGYRVAVVVGRPQQPSRRDDRNNIHMYCNKTDNRYDTGISTIPPSRSGSGTSLLAHLLCICGRPLRSTIQIMAHLRSLFPRQASRLMIAPLGIAKTYWISRWQSTTALSIEEEIEHANKKQDKVEIHRTKDNRGWGVFANKDFEVGDLVISVSALKVSSEQGSHTIQTGWNAHVYMDLPARFLNHVCGKATVRIRPNKASVYDFVAIAPIEKGSEVVWDYECSEYELDNFECACGLPTCRGQLRGFRYHRKLVVQSYGKDCIAPYLFSPHSVYRNPF